MKNAFLTNVKRAKEEGYRDGFWEGMRIGFNICAIKLNQIPKFRFGKQRLKELEAGVQDYVDDIIKTNDPYVVAVHINSELKRIRGKDWEDE